MYGGDWRARVYVKSCERFVDLVKREMAGNEWINGYLEAILDSRAGFAEESRPPAINLLERGTFNPTKYFVEEVVTGFDESDLHRTWLKVSNSVLIAIKSILVVWLGCLLNFVLWVLTVIIVLPNLWNQNYACVILVDFVSIGCRWWPCGTLWNVTTDWKICVGGFGIWHVERNRYWACNLNQSLKLM